MSKVAIQGDASGTGIYTIAAPNSNNNRTFTLPDAAGDLITGASFTGAVMYFAMSGPPTGWVKANGAALNRTTYAELFTAIGTTFGSGDGSTTFNVPDLRGEFLRALDDGAGIDTGRTLGSTQSAANLEHGHYVGTGSFTSGGGGNGGAYSAGDAYRQINANISTYRYGGVNTTVYPTDSNALKAQNDGGSEARPRNIALLACIKY